MKITKSKDKDILYINLTNEHNKKLKKILIFVFFTFVFIIIFYISSFIIDSQRQGSSIFSYDYWANKQTVMLGSYYSAPRYFSTSKYAAHPISIIASFIFLSLYGIMSFIQPVEYLLTLNKKNGTILYQEFNCIKYKIKESKCSYSSILDFKLLANKNNNVNFSCFSTGISAILKNQNLLDIGKKLEKDEAQQVITLIKKFFESENYLYERKEEKNWNNNKKTAMISIKLTDNNTFLILFYFTLLGLLFGLILLIPGFADAFSCFLMAIFCINFICMLFTGQSRLLITLYDETQLVNCSIYNIFGIKIKNYKVPFTSIADIKLIDYKNRLSPLSDSCAIKFLLTDYSGIVLKHVPEIEAEKAVNKMKNIISIPTGNNEYEE